MFYGTREEQGQLLQQVLAANDMDAEEERVPGEGPQRPGVSISNIKDLLLYQYSCNFFFVSYETMIVLTFPLFIGCAACRKHELNVWGR